MSTAAHRGGAFSCGRNGRAVINATRWRRGATTWPSALELERFAANERFLRPAPSVDESVPALASASYGGLLPP